MSAAIHWLLVVSTFTCPLLCGLADCCLRGGGVEQTDAVGQAAACCPRCKQTGREEAARVALQSNDGSPRHAPPRRAPCTVPCLCTGAILPATVALADEPAASARSIATIDFSAAAPSRTFADEALELAPAGRALRRQMMSLLC